MGKRGLPVHPPLPASAQSTSTVNIPTSVVNTKTMKRKTFDPSDDGILSDTWPLHSTTFNKWIPMSAKYKFIVRYSRDALISDPFKHEELANYNGAKGVEIRKLPNKHGNNFFSHG